MTIQTISKQHIGGATEKKDQAEWMNDDQSSAVTSRLLVSTKPLARRTLARA
jgi:hypothetical protein